MVDQDVRILTAMVSHLTPYVYEDDLFGHIGNRLPKLTIGGLLLRLYRVDHLFPRLGDQQQAEVEQARQHLDGIRYEWLSHYKAKVEQEFSSRLGAIRWYLDDCAENPAGCDSGWPNEAEKRTIIEHLRDEADRLGTLTRDMKGEVADLDTRMRRFFRPGKFLWDETYRGIYPQELFWWLYGRPGEMENDQ